jgi:hypothetical protein
MSQGSQRQPMRRSIRGGRPYFFADPAIDKVLNMVLTLASEVWTLRERVIAMEAIGATRGAFQPGEVDAFEFPPDLEAKLAADRKEFIEALFRVIGNAGAAPAAVSATPARPKRSTQRKKTSARKKKGK